MPFLSEESFDILSKIQRIAYNQCLNKVNTVLSSEYRNYANFMTSLDYVETLHTAGIFDKFIKDKCSLPLVETSAVILNRLEQIFQTSSNGSLGYFYDHAQSPFKIENEVNETGLLVFKNNIENCIHTIWQVSPLLYKFCCRFILSVIPIKSTQALSTNLHSFSSHKALGTIFLSYAEDEDFNQINYITKIAHELGHQLLYLYQTSDELILSDKFSLVYSGVRKTFRPAIMAFHAAVVLTHMKNITKDMLHNKYNTLDLDRINKKLLEEKYDEYSDSLTMTIESIQKNCKLTNFGNEILSNLTSI